jgi:hypothetical protein
VRPRDDTSIGHIVASYLALRLQVDLSMQLEKKGVDNFWPDLMRALKGLHPAHLSLDGRAYRIYFKLLAWPPNAVNERNVRGIPL